MVLGGTGFLGGALYRQLAEAGYSCLRVGSRDLDLAQPGGSEQLAAALEGASTLAVASALTPPAANSLAGLHENLAIVSTIVRALEVTAPPRCLYLSSDAVYGWRYDPVTEETPVEPPGYYAIANYAGERLMQTIAEARGSSLLTLRPVAVFGPGDTHDAYGPNRFVRSIVAERRVTLFGGGDDVRDHLYVGDFARLAVLLLEAGAEGLYNLATGVGRTFASIVEDLRRLAPWDFEVMTASRPISLTHRTFDITRLRRATPTFRFTPFEVALEETLAAAAAVLPRSRAVKRSV